MKKSLKNVYVLNRKLEKQRKKRCNLQAYMHIRTCKYEF